MIVGLTGRKQAGKNAAAKLLAVYSPLPVVEVAFADLLKQAAAATLGCTVADLERWKNYEHAVVSVGEAVEEGWLVGGKTQTVRSYIQRFGQHHRDRFGEDFWVDKALPRGRSYTDALYVVTDVRYLNEAQRVKALDGELVLVVGPVEVERAVDTHVSEKPLADELIDYALNNRDRTDGFAGLDFQVRKLLHWLDLEPKRSAEAWAT